ncbi:MAG: hypothetical protein P4N59_13090 [Negativicutes bacterium]|nr:hypothetical protein [Negativicutes bacterium]
MVDFANVESAVAAGAADVENVVNAVSAVPEAAALVAKVQEVVAPLENRVASIESVIENFGTAHPALHAIVSLLGKYFPNEVGVIAELL